LPLQKSGAAQRRFFTWRTGKIAAAGARLTRVNFSGLANSGKLFLLPLWPCYGAQFGRM
jgi:hypothetical protein